MKTIAPLVALLLLLTGCGGGATAPAAAPPAVGTEEGAKPVGLEIPAIDVHVTNLEPTGVNSTGDYTCPDDPNTVAWNADGTLPGQPGTAVIVAPSPGAFQRLAEIGPDDPIVVDRADGTKATFRETEGTSTPAGARPARLQLSGCGDQAAVTVYAELVP
jgi:sortase family protein